MMHPIDFEAINAAALRIARSLLHELLPGGKFEGDEYVVRNPLRNDQNPGSFKINSKTGKWSDFAKGKGGGDLISLIAYLRGSTQLEAARELAAKVGIPLPDMSDAPRDRNDQKRDVKSWNVVMPVPASAPGPRGGVHPKLGRPTRTWAYKSAAGDLIGYVLRFDNSDAKEFRPLTLWRHSVNGRLEWRWESWPPKRPLYGLQELAERPSAAVVVCEGEKSANAARRLLSDFVAVTSPNGSESAEKADWSPLSGRNVVIWPDADAAGNKYAQAVSKCAAGAGAATIAVIPLPGDVDDGWDAADALEEGWTPERAAELIAKAVPQENPGDANCTKEPPWPLLDGAAYYGLAGDVVKTIEPHSESDPIGILIGFLTTFGNIVGNNPYYQVESDRHHANLFCVYVGNSAKGRKGTAAGRVKDVTKLADEVWFDARTASGLSSGEGLINAVRDQVTKWDAKAQQFEVADPGVADKRLLVTEPEFAGALSAMERHGNTLSPVIRNAWDGQVLQTLTRTSPLKATGAHVSIIAHITEDEARARLTRTEMANGFANRFLFCCMKRSKLLPHGGALAETDLLDLRRRVKEAVEFARQVGRIKMTDEAAKAWEAAYPELSAERAGLAGAVIARSEAQVIRLSLIYALLDCQDAISPHHLEAAIAVWAYCEESALRIFGTSLGDPIADDILRALRESGATGMTRTAINSLFSRNRSSDQISAALTLLTTKGYARAEPKMTNGRSSEIWFAVGGRR
jgi:DNA primase